MRLVRAAGQNISPSDDGRLYNQIFSDGLFTETTFASLGADSVRIGAMYGVLCGRDFTIEQQTITVQLPEGEGETTGYIYVEIDLSAETPLSVGSALAPFTPTYEDINVNGAVCQMIVAEYTATALAVTSVTAVYEKAAASSVKAGSIATVENSTATEAHDVGEYILLNGQMYIITAAVSIGETFIEGTNISAVSIGDELTSLNAGLASIQSGVTEMQAINYGAGVNFTVTFDTPFSTIPNVVCVPMAEGSSGAPILRVQSVTVTGFQARIYNSAGSGNTMQCGLSWIAVAI